MVAGFRRARRGRAVITLSPAEVDILASLFAEILDLLEEPEAAGEVTPGARDPLEDVLGPAASGTPPADPALRRLLPDAYPDDPDAAADFRRFTEGSLRRRKRSDAEAALSSLTGLGAAGGHLSMDATLAAAWLTALNDVRLALGTRLGITADDEGGDDEEDGQEADGQEADGEEADGEDLGRSDLTDAGPDFEPAVQPNPAEQREYARLAYDYTTFVQETLVRALW